MSVVTDTIPLRCLNRHLQLTFEQAFAASVFPSCYKSICIPFVFPVGDWLSIHRVFLIERSRSLCECRGQPSPFSRHPYNWDLGCPTGLVQSFNTLCRRACRSRSFGIRFTCLAHLSLKNFSLEESGPELVTLKTSSFVTLYSHDLPRINRRLRV